MKAVKLPAGTVPTTEANKARISKMTDKVAILVQNLACRWADEHEYEDIREYQKVLQKHMPKGFTILKMGKRPFGFTFSIGTDAVYQIYCGRYYGWHRIK